MDFEKARLDWFESLGVPMQPRRLRAADGRETYCLVRGSGNVPLVFVHGGLAEASNWAPLVSRLRDRYVVCVDRPGCGLSDGIDYRRYRGEAYQRHAATWLESVADGLGAGQIDVVGNSMGGFFALSFALAHPDRVRRLIFTGAPAGLDREVPFMLRLMASPLGSLLQRLAPIRDVATLRERVFKDMLVVDANRVSDAQLTLGLLNNALPGVPFAAHTMLQTVLSPFGWRRKLLMREKAKQLRVPTLFLWGDRDAFAPPSSGQEIAAAIGPHAELRVIENGGHIVSLDQPDRVAAEIERFLETPRLAAAV